MTLKTIVILLLCGGMFTGGVALAVGITIGSTFLAIAGLVLTLGLLLVASAIAEHDDMEDDSIIP